MWKLALSLLIACTAAPDSNDAFKTKQVVDLRGTVTARICTSGSLWVFVLYPERSGVRSELDALAARATCDQPASQNAKR